MFCLYKPGRLLLKITTHATIMLLAFAGILATTLLSSCLPQFDRKTSVHGSITDLSGAPVDSILVILQGGWSLYSLTTLGEVYTDKEGNYELVINIPKKFHSAHLGVPNWPSKNPKFMKKYKNYAVQKNGKSSSCCRADMGEKTKYDFQLTPK